MQPDTEWYVRSKNGSYGPYSEKQIQEFASNGKLPRSAHLSQNKDGPWIVAETVEGVFETSEEMKPGDYIPEVVKHSASAVTSAISGLSKSIASHVKKTNVATQIESKPVVEIVTPPVATQVVETTKVAQVSRKPCPFCGESITMVAIKCKHCGEFLDEAKRPATINIVQQQAPQHIQTIVQMTPQPKWSPGVAAVLSFLFPGLGQMYKGQIFNGLLWMVITVVGYICFIVPGVVLHLCCVIGAASGNPNK